MVRVEGHLNHISKVYKENINIFFEEERKQNHFPKIQNLFNEM